MGGCDRQLTRYQPVGFPEDPSWSWEVRTMRILGAMVSYSRELCFFGRRAE